MAWPLKAEMDLFNVIADSERRYHVSHAMHARGALWIEL